MYSMTGPSISNRQVIEGAIYRSALEAIQSYRYLGRSIAQ